MFYKNSLDVPTNYREIIQQELALLNISRVTLFAKIIAVAELALFYVDYQDYIMGLWQVSPGYKLLLYSRILFVVCMLIVIVLNFLYFRNWQGKATFLANAASTFFATAILGLGAWISGCIEQLLHIQTIVYIMAAFFVAAVVYFKPVTSLFIYCASYALFLSFLNNYQSDPVILRANYVNGSILVILAWSFSVILSNSRIRDLKVKNYLEATIAERTKELRASNISLKNEIEEKRQAAEKILQLAAIVESSVDGIYSITIDGRITSWNQGAERIFGYSNQEILSNSIFSLAPIEYHDEIKALVKKVMNGEKISNLQTKRQRKDGQLIDVSLTISPLKNVNGEIIGASSIVRDITETKRMEKELAKLDQLNLISQMAAGISHEVRNPMTTVRGFLQILGEKHDCNSYKNYFDLMINELDRANAILTEFLLIGKNNPTKLHLQNLNSIIQNLLPLIEVHAAETGKLLAVELKEIPDIALNAAEMRQVLLNLTRNGLEAMSEGGLLTIKTKKQEDNVILTITDQGKGIDPSILANLGTPFVTNKDSGTGLGLAICYSIAARHNAVLSFETGSLGTTFSLTFPIVDFAEIPVLAG
ncbi:MAG: PAS domain S-box protein [Desulfitobacterium hafniense]|nr:PAS domain S-box protein [Desulfitobacterium hafniense]